MAFFNLYREICPAKNVRNNFEQTIFDFTKHRGKTDYYYSFFLYESPFLEANYRIDHVIIDIDTDDLLSDESMKVCRNVIDLLKEKGIPHINYFSGRRGFHIKMPNCWEFTKKDVENSTMKNTMVKTFPGICDKIYKKKSLIRMPNTAHPSTGLFKRLISSDTIMEGNPDYILMYCQKPDDPDQELTQFQWEDFPNLSEEKIHSISKPVMQAHKSEDSGWLPSPKCIHKMLRSGPLEGQRHVSAIRIASHLFHYHHYEKVVIKGTLSEWWGDDFDEPWFERVFPSIKEKYKYGCNDPVLAAHCDKTCKFKKLGNYMSGSKSILSIVQSHKESMDAGKYIDIGRIMPAIGSSFIVNHNDVLSILGPPGSGKTTFAIDLMLHVLNREPDKFYGLMINIDTSNEMTVRRMIQRFGRYTKDEVNNPTSSQWEDIQAIASRIDNMMTIMDDYSIESVVEKLGDWQKHFPRKPNIVILDHVGNVEFPVGGYARNRDLGKLMKTIAKQHHCIFMPISHITKADGRANSGRGEINVHSARDAALGENSDVMIGITDTGRTAPVSRIHVSGILESNYKIVKMTSPKSRDNEPIELEMIFNHDYFQFEPLNLSDQHKTVNGLFLSKDIEGDYFG
jgi:KaiC/GvpD/RAD55 family RecA-like ATPase